MKDNHLSGKFVVYRSSAGSGKTFTLAGFFLRLLFEQKDPNYYRTIPAITFTNKAAAEMKSRVLDYLEGFAGGLGHEKYNAAMAELILLKCGMDAKTLQTRSDIILRHILHGYSQLAIGTIDRFAHRIIRSFAYELDLDPDFEVHMKSEEAISAGTDLLMEAVGTDTDLTRKLQRFTEFAVDEENSFNIRKPIEEFGKKAVFNEQGVEMMEALRDFDFDRTEAARRALWEEMDQFYHALRQLGRPAVAILDALGDELSLVNTNVLGCFRRAAVGETGNDATARKAAEAGSVLTLKGFKSASHAALAAGQELARLAGEIIALTDRDLARITYFEHLHSELYSSATASALRVAIDEANRLENRLSIGDFNRIIHRVVIDNPAPFIYERIGNRYRHFLIDEFQDVSVLQWLNFLPLLENALASGQSNLVVGDAKQSIYRWRNGDFRQFTALPAIRGAEDSERLLEIQSVLERTCLPMALGTNYRSGRHIVEFNNRLFARPATGANSELERVYADTEQKWVEKPDMGYVRMDCVSREVAKEEDEDEWKFWLMDRIRDTLADGYQHGDMALLFRKNDDSAVAAEFLTLNGIQVVTSESLRLSGSPLCSFLIAALAYVTGPGEASYALTAARSYCQLTKPTMSFHTAISPFVSKQIGRRSARIDLQAFLQSCGATLPGVAVTSVYEWMENALRAANLTDRCDAFGVALLNKISALSASGISRPEAFLRWWDENGAKLSLDLPDNPMAVKIMTMHTAKGLQFPVVIIPVMSVTKGGEVLAVMGDRLPHGIPAAMLKTAEWMKGTPLEDLYTEHGLMAEADWVNLLYVAFTRPERRLLVRVAYLPRSTPPEVPFLHALLKDRFGLVGDVFEYGERMPAAPAPVPESEVPVPTDLISETWTHRLRLHLQSAALAMPGAARREEGNLIHTLFAALPEGRSGVLLDEMLGCGLVSQGAAVSAKAIIDRLAALPSVMALLAAPRVFTERELTGPDGTVMRPDLVAEWDDRIEVVDLKTGTLRPEHHRQVAAYAWALREARPDKAVLAYLLEAESGSLIACAEDG